MFESATFSFGIQKFPRPDVSVFKSDLPVHTYPTRIPIHSTTQDSSAKIGKRMRRKALEICILLCLERTWERSWHLNYSIHGKELSLILLRHRITKHPDLASTRFRIHGVFKNFLSGERIQKVADSYAGLTGYVWTEAVSGKKRLRIQEYPDTCGRGFKWTYHRLRPLKKESSNQPVSVKVLYFLHKFVKFHDFSMKRVCKLKGRQFPCFMSPESRKMTE